MAIREVKICRKDDSGEIVALCNPEAFWSPRLKGDAIHDIQNNIHTYYVLCNGRRVDIEIIKNNDGISLQINSAKTINNNLVDLPNH
jgi:hypothetical protein